MIGTVLVLPSPLALLPPVSTQDPVAELRAACEQAVSELPDGEVIVVATPTSPESSARGVTDPLGHRVARHLLGDRPFVAELALPWTAASLLGRDGGGPGPSVLVVMADGSARRLEKAPGHLHPDAVPFDDALEKALRTGDADALALLDPEVATELWCESVSGWRLLGEVTRDRGVGTEVTYAEAPYGVAWWVARWDLS